VGILKVGMDFPAVPLMLYLRFFRKWEWHNFYSLWSLVSFETEGIPTSEIAAPYLRTPMPAISFVAPWGIANHAAESSGKV